MKIKDLNEPIVTDDFWYDLTDGGYIKPEDVLEYQQDIYNVNEALKVLMKFKRELEDSDMMEYV